MKRYFKSISLALSIIMVFMSVPTRVFADDSNKTKSPKTEIAKNNKPDEKGEVKILGEVTEKREKNIKHFLKDDNSYEAVVYPVPVHYLDKGQWKEIDNTLEESTEGQNKVLKNKQNDFQVSFSKNAKSDKLIKLIKDKYELSWSVENVENSLANVNNSNEAKLTESIEKEASNKIEKDEKLKTLNSDEKNKVKKVIIENEKKRNSVKVISSAEFKQILPNVDLRYDLQGDTIKENITINKPSKDLNIDFRINTKNLVPKLEKDNTILFLDEKDNKPVFKMKAPFMYDSKGAESNKVELSLKKVENTFVLSLKPNAEWLNSSERLYPVVIDPPVETSLNINEIRDTFVCSSDTEDKASNILLRVGNTPGVGITRSYLKFALPQLNSADMVTKAVLKIYSDSVGDGGAQVNVHNVTSSWNTPGILWSNKPNYNSRVEDYVSVGGSGWYYPDVTRIVKEWYNNGSNNGIMLKASNENSGYVAFRSSDTTDTNARPSVIINYVNNSGLESYWTYHSQSIGRAGTAYVNDYTGNLVLIHDDLNMSGSRMPINLKHVYNSNNKDIDLGMGKGWRLSYNLRIELKNFIDGQRYAYTDEDGTVHYFKAGSDGIYRDESGLDLTLTINSNGTYIIKDKKNNQIYFTAQGYLDKIVDVNGNVLEANYSSGQIYKITDGSGRVTNIDHPAGGKLASITDSSGRKISFEYVGDLLHKITYPDGKYSIYWYDNNGVINQVVNYDGYRMTYNYTSASPFRVAKVFEDNTNGTIGKELNISYEQNMTTFTDVSDSRNRKNYYQFNNYGNTTCIVDQDGSAQYYKYFDDSINRNKMQLTSKLQKTVTNPIMNHSAEISDLYWVAENWTGSTGTGVYTTEEKYIGNQSLKITKTNLTSDEKKNCFTYNINLTKGKTYTFSAYVKTAGISNNYNRGAEVFVNYKDSSGNWKSADSIYINGTNDWQRIQTTFTLPSDAASDTVSLRTGISDETGTAYFDCMQLDEGIIANRYNLVDNSDLFYASNSQPTFWTPDADNNPQDDKYTEIDGRSTFKIAGSSSKRKNIYHTVNVSGKKGDNLVLSGWAKADAVPELKDSGREFSLCAGIQRMDGTFQWVSVLFNSASSQWQYVSDVIIPDSDYKSVRVYGLYYKNENTAYFDSIQLYKEEFGTSYAYDDKGNIKSTQDLAKQTSTFEYSANNDLIKTTDPKGNQFKYEYDSKHNITKATTAENVVYSFSYDSNGNPQTARIGDSTLFIQSSATYTTSGNYAKTITDPSGNTVSYNYDETKDTLDTVTDANNNSIFNSYDNMDRLTSVYSIKGDTPGESFPMNGTTVGSKGTRPITDNSGYTTDENGRTVLSCVDGKKVIYNLGINKNSGTMTAWFKTSLANATRYIMVGDGSNSAMLHMYIGADNKLKLAVRDTATNWKEFISSTDVINLNTWYFGGFTWKMNGSSLQCSLYLNDKVYTGSITNFLDFSGATTTIGGLTARTTDTLNGQLEQFVYSSSALSDGEINQNADSIYKKGRGNYLTEKSECFPMNGSATGSKGTKAAKDTSVYANDENGKLVFSAYNGSLASYNLGVNKNYGTISTWFNTKVANATRYIVVNDGNNAAMLDMYIGADNKLKLAVRDTATNWKEFITSADTISTNTWYFAALSWNLNGSNLECNLYLNDKVYSGTVSNILDFSGGTTTIGAAAKGSDNLNGQLEQFTFSNRKLTTSEINQGANSIYGRGRGNYLSSTYVNNKYSYLNDRISSITHNGFSYNFEYDSFGRNTKVSVGSQNLITNQYETRTGKLLQSTYGNGHVVSNDYDTLDRVVSNKYNGASRYNYAYDAAGNLGYKEDLVNDVIYRYIYDTSNRLVRIQDSKGNKIAYDYDINNNLSKLIDNISGITYATSYVYDKDNRLKEVALNNGAKQTNTYDPILGRLSGKAINTGTTTYNTAYSYVPGINGSTTAKVSSITNNGVTVSYTYDKNGNIETINGDQIKYYYNELNELTREDNKVLNKTIVYTYDVGGNITSKIEYAYTTGTPTSATKTYNYTYGDSNWKDKLTNFIVDGSSRDITYDSIGNLKTYRGFTYEWESGRLLKSLSDGGKTFTYKYNDAGIRTEKNYNGVVTKYHLVGDKVTYEDNGTDKIYYTYNSNGKLISMNLNGEEYYYIRNAQGDIIGLFDKSGTQVVSYTYDSWGKLISIDGSLKDTVGVKNPYRYRGYRYDSDTGYYYLQSRYYNPEWGRFINADGIIGQTGELLGHNLFAYCKNNPVNMSDKSGFRAMPMCEDAEETEAVVTTASKISSVRNGVAAAGLDKASGDVTLSYAKTTPYEIYRTMSGNHTARRAYLKTIPKYERHVEFVPNNLKGVIAKYNAKVGFLGTLSLGMSLRSDYINYSAGDAAWCSAIDVGAFLTGIALVGIIPAATPIAAALVGTMLIGAATTYGADLAKDYLFTKRR